MIPDVYRQKRIARQAAGQTDRQTNKRKFNVALIHQIMMLPFNLKMALQCPIKPTHAIITSKNFEQIFIVTPPKKYLDVSSVFLVLTLNFPLKNIKVPTPVPLLLSSN